MRIQVCYYCSGPIYPGHGMVFMRNDGQLFRFCRSKCHRHFKAKHNPRKTKWTKACRQINGQEMIKDSVFEFEKRRNEPLVYNRDLFVTTIQCMQRLEEIKESREQIMWENRLQMANKKQKDDKLRDLETHITLVSQAKVKERIEENIAIKEKASKLAQLTSQQNPHKRINDMEDQEGVDN